MNKKYSRDFIFYLKNRKRFTFSPKFDKNVIKYKKDGADAYTSFVSYDSLGKIIPTKHPRLLKRIIITKGSVNFNIKQWAEGLASFSLIKIELEKYLNEINAPEWVLKACQKQRYKIIDKIDKKEIQSHVDYINSLRSVNFNPQSKLSDIFKSNGFFW